jgi:hypothetical protein
MWFKKLLFIILFFVLIVSCDISKKAIIPERLGSAFSGPETIKVELDPSQSSSYKLKGDISVTIPEGSVLAPDTLSAEVKTGEFSSDIQGKNTYVSDSVLEISLENQDFFHSPISIELPYDPKDFPEGRSENEISAFYLRDFGGIPVASDLQTDDNKITLKTLHPGQWTWGLAAENQSDEQIDSWLNTIASKAEAESFGKELYQRRLSEWETSWEQLKEQMNTLVELEEPMQIGFDYSYFPVKGVDQSKLQPLMDKFGINPGPAVLFIVGAQEVGVVSAVLGADYLIDYFGDPKQLNESIKNERRAWMRLKEAECVRDSINHAVNLVAKPYCFEILHSYVNGLQTQGLKDKNALDLEYSAITDEVFDRLIAESVREMAEIEDIFNVEIVDQEVSYDETGEKLELPDVTGMREENAVQLLRSLGFNVEIAEGSSDYDPGIIYKQVPEAGVFSDPTITIVRLFKTIDE